MELISRLSPGIEYPPMDFTRVRGARDCAEGGLMGIRLIRVLTRLGAGGPPIHCLTATREMAKVGYDATLVTGRCGLHDGDMSYLVRDDDRIVHLNSLTPLATIAEDVRSLFSLWRMFRRERPHIVHTH